jgi:hypothetical protein
MPVKQRDTFYDAASGTSFEVRQLTGPICSATVTVMYVHSADSHFDTGSTRRELLFGGVNRLSPPW